MSDSQKFDAHDLRCLLFSILYAAHASDYEHSLDYLADQFKIGIDYPIHIPASVIDQARSIINEQIFLDKEIVPLLENWRIERIGTPTLLILRIALWECIHSNLDRIIIINEAIELAKDFAEPDAHKFVNGVLDRWIKKQQMLPH